MRRAQGPDGDDAGAARSGDAGAQGLAAPVVGQVNVAVSVDTRHSNHPPSIKEIFKNTNPLSLIIKKFDTARFSASSKLKISGCFHCLGNVR